MDISVVGSSSGKGTAEITKNQLDICMLVALLVSSLGLEVLIVVKCQA